MQSYEFLFRDLGKGWLKPSRVILNGMKMYRSLLRNLLLVSLLYTPYILCAADSDSHNAYLRIRGAKIARLLCRQDTLRTLDLNASAATLRSHLKTACPDLDEEEYPALLSYMRYKMTVSNPLPPVRPIPKEARCPVCAMTTTLYPNWTTTIRTKGGKQYWFDGIKDMMYYYFDQAKYHYDRKEIRWMVVQEYYSLQPLDAKKAWYVLGSDARGPMGLELVPFSTPERAQAFLQDHHGRTILRFDQITPRILESLTPHTGEK